MHADRPRVGVVGHVEWVQFARVARVPAAGEVAHAREAFEEPAGGGAVAAVQLARLAGGALLLTALGEDEPGRRSRARLRELGVEVRAASLAAPTRRAVTLVDDRGERTITTFGERLEPPGACAALWEGLPALDALYFTAGDHAALLQARAAAHVLVASPRARSALGPGVELDALVLSASDALELEGLERAGAKAGLTCLTEGARGGRYSCADGRSGRWEPAPLPGKARDSYGAGDCFAAGLTYALGRRAPLAQALALGARCGAHCVAGRGPYERQLSAGDLARAR